VLKGCKKRIGKTSTTFFDMQSAVESGNYEIPGKSIGTGFAKIAGCDIISRLF
jgi:hypothetical protein